MKNKFIISIFLLFFIQQLQAQKPLKWYNTSTSFIYPKGSGGTYPSKLCDSVLTAKYALEFEYIKDFKLSTFEFLAKNEPSDFFVKDEILGIRGRIGSQQILIIDSDLDKSFTDEEIILLPHQVKDDSIPYNQEFVYKSSINKNISTTYEKVVDGLIHQKTTNLGISVNQKFDELSDQLQYIDIFTIGFNQRLVYKGLLCDVLVEISCLDYLPWVTSIRFTLSTTDFHRKRISIKTPFKIKEDGPLYIIDSVDFINNKFLIGEYGKSENFYFSGESLFSNKIIDTDSTTNNVKLIHVWGSWCAPCMRNLPKLKNLQQEFTNIEFIGICEERNKEDGATAANNAGITWKNIFSSFGNTQLNILVYPTYLVLRDNKVIKRTSKIDLVEEYIRSNIK